MTPFTPWSALAGGGMIGLAVLILLLTTGRIAGISGIIGGVLAPRPGDSTWRLAFIAGLLAGPAVYRLATGAWPDIGLTDQPAWLLASGLLVGFGTRLGSGCTSGHGVCGLARLSPRSMVATLLFMLSAGVTVFLIRHVLAATSIGL